MNDIIKKSSAILKKLQRKYAFSLVEIMMSLVLISVIAAAFAPVIARKYNLAITASAGTSNNVIVCPSPIDNCAQQNTACTQCVQCNAGYKIVGNKCVGCPKGFVCDGTGKQSPCTSPYYSAANAAACSKQTNVSNCQYYYTDKAGCTICNNGYILSSGACTACSAANCSEYKKNSCDCTVCDDDYYLSGTTCKKKSDGEGVGANWCNEGRGYLRISLNGKYRCITQYNLGDGPNGSGYSAADIGNWITLVRTGASKCKADYCCWRGATAEVCNSNDNSRYHGCGRTVCGWPAANKICSNMKMNGATFRLPTKDELALLAPSGHQSVGFCNRNDSSSTYARCSWGAEDMCKRSDSTYEQCYPYDVWSGTKDYTNYYYGYAFRAAYWTEFSDYYLYPFSARCING